MKPPYILPSMKLLLDFLNRQKEETLVIADHPARLGLKKDIRALLVQKIEEGGGKFIPIQTGAGVYIELYGAEIIETIKDMKF